MTNQHNHLTSDGRNMPPYGGIVLSPLVIWFCQHMMAKFCNNLPDDYAKMSDLYVDLSEILVNLSHLYIKLTENICNHID